MHRYYHYYFAARYATFPTMCLYREQLLERVPGATVTSRWFLNGSNELNNMYTPEFLTINPEVGWKHAERDLIDLQAADTTISFTHLGVGKGGRHVEFGYAVALNHRLIIIGPRENVFHCNPVVEQYSSWDEFLEYESESVVN